MGVPLRVIPRWIYWDRKQQRLNVGFAKKRSMTRKPCAPTPMKAMLTLSLGGTYPVPPNTWRGTMDRPIAARGSLRPGTCAARNRAFRNAAKPNPILHGASQLQFTDNTPFWPLHAFCEDLPQC